MRWSTCWSRRPTAAIAASAPGVTSGGSAAGNVRPANFAPTALRDGWQRERPAHEPREPTPARMSGFPGPVRAYHPGGELADRQCRHIVRPRGTVPHCGFFEYYGDL